MTSLSAQALTDLLGGPLPAPAEADRILGKIPFEDQLQALTRIRNIPKADTSTAYMTVLPNILRNLQETAYPDRVLINFEKLVQTVPDASTLFNDLARQPRMLEALFVLFAGSQFLTDVLIRYPEYLQQFRETTALARVKSRQQIYSETIDCMSPEMSLDDNLDELRRFQRKELLRIGSGDLVSAISFQGVIDQLSSLARCIVRACLNQVSLSIGIPTEGFAVIALGKLGGRELNYSSDVDLIFVSREQSEAYKRLGQELIRALGRATSEGFLYRIDMRLRPWGQSGTLVPTVAENLQYLHSNAQLWEKQAMFKGRRIAGDDILGIEFLEQVKELLVGLPAAGLRREALKMKNQIEKGLRRKGRDWGEVKGGAGSVRDVEFVTQYLQLAHGEEVPEIKSRNTLDALARLTASGILPDETYRILTNGYVFMRTIEHHLQIMHYRQTHLLPTDRRELRFLARRLGFQGRKIGEQMVARYEEHRAAIKSVFDTYFLAEETSVQTIPDSNAAADLYAKEHSRHIARMGASYLDTFPQEEIDLHADMAESLTREDPVRLDVTQLPNSDWRLTIVGIDVLGELSLICGLLFDRGLSVVDGTIFTYEPDAQQSSQSAKSPARRKRRRFRKRVTTDTRKKIVDVFTVRAIAGNVDDRMWQGYAEELSYFVKQLRDRKQNEVQGELAKRVATAMTKYAPLAEKLLPVEIAFDNRASDKYTVLRIDAPDTAGFLYELTNALALNGIYIARMLVRSFGERIHDTLFVADALGQKITDPQRQYQLRAATVLVKHFTHLLPQSPNPYSAVLHFREFVSNLFIRGDWHHELHSLERPEVLDALVKILGVSDFLWNDFLRMQHANIFPLIKDVKRLNIVKSKAHLQEELRELLSAADDWQAKTDCLNAFKDREMFRIDMRYIMGLNKEFRTFTFELSDLADIVIEETYKLCYDRQVQKLGCPLLANGSVCGVAVFALGKLGGHEIGFASDIEIMLLFEGEPGESSTVNQDFTRTLVEQMQKAIKSKQEGIFEIDLRIRPFGKGGTVAVAFDTFKKYYARGGQAWDYERQALVKMRPVAGDVRFAQTVLEARDAAIYTDHAFEVTSLRAMRERQVRQLVAGGSINAKFSPGGLVDLEYLIQGLQLQGGHEHPSLRVTNTSDAMHELGRVNILAQDDLEKLKVAHTFLRRVIEGLRMVRGHAKDLAVPNRDSDEFRFLARRLGYYDKPEQLHEDLLQHTKMVQEISRDLLG